MPELLEVESYRHTASVALGRRIASVRAPDPLVLRDVSARQLGQALRGRTLVAARRHGKLLVVETDGPALGLHFGMTGRLVVDGVAAIDELVYSSRRDDRSWDRLVLGFAEGGELRLNDPRRLARIELEPDTDRLGPDAVGLRLSDLRRLLSGRSAPLKAVLMDQRRVAGLGNLLCDEILWFAGLDPRRPGGELSDDELRRLHRAVRRTLEVLGRRGGSHTGDTFAERRTDGRCPRDGAALRHDTVGGRTTWWCPSHQT